MSDTEFVQKCADRLSVGFATRGMPLASLADLLFSLLKTRDVKNPEHMKILLAGSYAALVCDVQQALRPQDEQRLYSILMKYR
jgi:hypothetical protein